LYNKLLSESNIKAGETLNKLYISKEETTTDENKNSFKDIINNEIERLNNSQIKADKITEDLISGQVDDLHSVLIATEEARISLELAVQVRNKVIEAYKELNNMQL
jgi:flagellar hook-basal body complex protein FliE